MYIHKYIFYVYFACMYARIPGSRRSPKRMLDPLEPEFQWLWATVWVPVLWTSEPSLWPPGADLSLEFEHIQERLEGTVRTVFYFRPVIHAFLSFPACLYHGQGQGCPPDGSHEHSVNFVSKGFSLLDRHSTTMKARKSLPRLGSPSLSQSQ